MIRREPNWVALVIGAVYTVCFLFLPFCGIVGLPVNGLKMISVSAVMILPLVLGLLLMLSAFLFNEKLSIAMGAVVFIATLVLVLCCGSLVAHSSMLPQGLVPSYLSSYASLIVTTGIGAILCLLLAVGFAVAEFLMTNHRPSAPISAEQDFFS